MNNFGKYVMAGSLFLGSCSSIESGELTTTTSDSSLQQDEFENNDSFVEESIRLPKDQILNQYIDGQKSLLLGDIAIAGAWFGCNDLDLEVNELNDHFQVTLIESDEIPNTSFVLFDALVVTLTNMSEENNGDLVVEDWKPVFDEASTIFGNDENCEDITLQYITPDYSEEPEDTTF